MTNTQANIELNKLLKQMDDLLNKQYTDVGKRILSGYEYALTNIKRQLSEIFEQYNGNPTITELRKYNRLDSLEKQITKVIGEMQQKELNIISSNVKSSLKDSYVGVEDAFNTATGLNFAFDILPKESIDFVLTYNRWRDGIKNGNAKLLTDVLTENENYLRANASQEIAGGLAEGKTYGQVIRAIQDRFDVTTNRATVIAHDQMHAGAMAGRNEGFKSAIESGNRLGLVTYKVWKHNDIAKTPRLDHVRMNGKKADKNGIFTLPDGTKTEAPGLTGKAKHDIFCFPDFVNVASPSKVQKVYRRKYEGDLIEITTACGIKLTGTPNHPIMTEQGFVALNSLNQGDGILYTTLRGDVSSIKPNINNTVTKFSEVFDFFNVRFSQHWIRGMKENFHGDGSAENIDIIFINSFLWNAFKSIFFKPIGKLYFTLTYSFKIFFKTDCSFTKFRMRCNSIFTSLMSFFDLLKSLSRRHLLPIQKICFGLTSSDNIVFDENSFNYRTTDTKRTGNLIFWNSAKIIFNDFFCINFFKNIRFRMSKFQSFGCRSFGDFILSKKNDQSRLTNSINLSKFFLSNAGIIESDKVIQVRRIEGFCGHVYNLQTKDGYYLVNDSNTDNLNDNHKYIIAHNCRCSLEFNIEGLD